MLRGGKVTNSHIELSTLNNILLPKSTRLCLEEYLNLFTGSCSSKYIEAILWKEDQRIGGIGGYCMPQNPVKNPFPSGIKRELYRPLQYARAEIDI